MDNQHVEVPMLAYMAGFIDGEGTITLERTGNRRMSGVMGLSPKVLVANTNEAMIAFAQNSFRALGVNPHIKSQEAGLYGRRKKMYWVTVQGLSKTAKVLVPLLPYLVGKLAQAHLVLDFIQYRGESEAAKGKPYGEYEFSILSKIRALNGMSASETEDRAHRLLDELEGAK